MRIYEYRQSATSPLKYHLEFSPEEFKIVKELVMDMMEKIKTYKKEEVLYTKAWIEDLEQRGLFKSP
jgi:hypothetical protein